MKPTTIAIALTTLLGITTISALPAFAEGRVDGVGYGNDNRNQTPVTYTSVQDANRIAIQITEGEFQFHGILNRTMGNRFSGSNGRVRVMYDRDQGRVVVINEVTGTEFYNYSYQPRHDEYRPVTGEPAETMCDPRREPC